MRKILMLSMIVFAVLIFAKPKIAIYGFFSETFSKKEIVSLNSILESSFVDLGYFTVLDRARIDVILKERGLEDIGLVGSKEDALKIGKLVGADFVVYGTVERAFGTQTMVTLSVKIVDIATGEIVFSDSTTVAEISVEDGIRSIVGKVKFENGKIVKSRFEKQKIVEKERIGVEKESKGWFSAGVTLFFWESYDYYYGYYTEEYLPLPWLKFGSLENDTLYGFNVWLGLVFRKYFGMFYFEAGTIALILPYAEVGISLGMIDFGYTITISADEWGDILFPNGPSVYLSFKF